MSDKYLSEAAWKAVANKAKVKDNGLCKALANAARLAEDDLEGRDAALDEAGKLAEKLLKDKLVAASAAAKEHLQEVLEAAGRERSALEKELKAAGEDEGDASARLAAELNRVKNGGGKVSSQFIVLAGPTCELIVAKRITTAMKAALKSKAGGRKLIQGSIALEAGKCTFLADNPVTGLAKNLQKAIQAQTGKTVPVRARDAKGGGVAEEAGEAEEAPGGKRGLTLETQPAGGGPATPAPKPPAGRAKDGTGVKPVDDDDDPVRPSEMIAGSSGVQPSEGRTTNAAAAEGGDFAGGVRANAGSGPDPENPMQSANLKGLREFRLRYGIGFLCADYSKEQAPGIKLGNLNEVAGYSKPNSTYLKAFQGMDKTKQYENPVAADILKTLNVWVGQLAKDLPKTGQGELVVSFQGHGSQGNFYACDGMLVTKEDMLGIARQAEKKRVSITFMLDACYAGAAVAGFQDHAADAVDERIDEFVEGEGLMSSEENHARAEAARDRMAHARELIDFSQAITDQGDEIMKLLGKLASQKTAANVTNVMKKNAEMIKLIRAMQGQFRVNLDIGNDPKMMLDQTRKSFVTVLDYLGAIPPLGPFNPDEWTRALGKFQDTVSDGANRILRQLDAQARGARRRTQLKK